MIESGNICRNAGSAFFDFCIVKYTEGMARIASGGWLRLNFIGFFIIISIYFDMIGHIKPSTAASIPMNPSISDPRPVSVLFVCIHNSARSQMAEAFLNKYGNGRFVVESAGIEPGLLNLLVVKAMSEIGIDISTNVTKDVQTVINRGRTFDYVVTVCDETSAERCPIFPGVTTRLHWGFSDPSQLAGTDEEKLPAIRNILRAIESRVREFVAEVIH